MDKTASFLVVSLKKLNLFGQKGMGFVCFVKWKTPLGSTLFRWIPKKSMPSKSTASDSVPVRVRSPAPRKARPQTGSRFSYCMDRRTRTHLNASVRWTLAATSANTGGYLYFLPSAENANRVRHRHEPKARVRPRARAPPETGFS